MNSNSRTGTFKTQTSIVPSRPIYVRYRIPIVVLLVLAGGVRYYTARDKAANSGDRVHKSRADLDRMQREQDEKVREAEARLQKRRPASAAAIAASVDVTPIPPEEMKTETPTIYVEAANEVGLRLTLKTGTPRARLAEISQAFAGACLVPRGVTPTCKLPIAIEASAWTALFGCDSAEALAQNLVRVTLKRKAILHVARRELVLAPDANPGEVEIADVFWKDASACQAFAKRPPAPIALGRIYALGRGVP